MCPHLISYKHNHQTIGWTRPGHVTTVLTTTLIFSVALTQTMPHFVVDYVLECSDTMQRRVEMNFVVQFS